MCEVNGPQHQYLREFFQSDQLPETCDPTVDFDLEQIRHNSLQHRQVWDSRLNKRIACEVGGRIKHWLGPRWIFRGYIPVSSGLNGETYRIDNTVIRTPSFDRPESNIDELAIVKQTFPNISDDDAQLMALKEAYIGLKLNYLRTLIPNFSMIYGIYEQDDSIIPLIAMEYIKNRYNAELYTHRVRFSNVDISTRLRSFIMILCQIVGSISMANQMFDFTHYDLHPHNVLIQEGSADKYVKYTIGGRDYYIVQDKIATIIDYGYSHIKIPEATSIPEEYRFLGVEGLEKYYGSSRQSFVMHDVWRFYYELLTRIRNSDPELYIELQPIQDYFYRADEYPQLHLARDGKVSTNDTGKGFIEFLRLKYPTVMKSIVRYRVDPTQIFNCSNLACDDDFIEEVPLSLVKIYRDLKTGRNIVSDIKEYRDYINHMTIPSDNQQALDMYNYVRELLNSSNNSR